MRVGIITGEYPPMQGGVGAYTQIFARSLARQGHTVSVLTSALGGPGDGAIPVTNVIERWDVRALRVARRWASGHALDLVNLQFQTAAFGMSPWVHFLPGVLSPTPVITTFHDLRYPYLFPKAGRLREWIVTHLARASRGVIVTNHEDMVRLAGLAHVALIPIGSNITAALPPNFDRNLWRVKAGAGQEDFLIAYFGFANRSKGLDILLDSLALLRQDRVPAALVLIGGRTGASDPTNAAYANEIDEKIETLEMQSFVRRTGFVEDDEVAAYLAAADAVALPFLDGASYRRGTLMAAIQHACPIVTTEPAIPIPPFVHGENMLLVPPGDPATLAAALRSLYESSRLRETLRRGAAELAPLFDWSHIAAEASAFFERVLNR